MLTLLQPAAQLLGWEERGWLVWDSCIWDELIFSLEVLTSLQWSSVSMYFHACTYGNYRGVGEVEGGKNREVRRREREEEGDKKKKKHLRPFKGCAFMKFIIVS